MDRCSCSYKYKINIQFIIYMLKNVTSKIQINTKAEHLKMDLNGNKMKLLLKILIFQATTEVLLFLLNHFIYIIYTKNSHTR